MPTFDFVLAGRYRLIAPLGEGGMAAVYRARDLRLNREVAVKVLHEDLTRDPEFLERFRREAQTVASLSHPNIVPVYDVGEEQGAHFIVMEYVRGRTLKEAIELEGRIPPERSVSIMSKVLDALEYAHSRNLVHRDVKPQNILLAPDGAPRLADFGIAHVVDGSTTRTAAILGSAHYLSPEQSRGEEATARSDLYACGVVLYEMLAGRPPFDGSNALAVASQHISSPPPPLRDRAPAVGPPLERTVMRALAKDPDERFSDAASFAAAIQSTSPSNQDTQPLPVVRDATDETDEHRAIPALTGRPRPAAAPGLVVRRSGRKSYALAAFLALGVAVAAYLASLPASVLVLPHYPSAPYAVLPAGVALFVLGSWLSARSWIYTLDRQAAVAQWGVIAHHRFGVPLRTITTLELKQSPIDRLLGVGTVELHARDANGAERRLVMEDVPRPRETYEELLKLVGRSSARQSQLEQPAK